MVISLRNHFRSISPSPDGSEWLIAQRLGYLLLMTSSRAVLREPQQILVILLVTLVVGCSGPSKSDVCSGCTGDERDVCEESYDQCEQISNCSKKNLKRTWAEGVCQGDFGK